MEKENRKIPFEVRMQKGKNGIIEKAIFIDGELLDWKVDMTSFMEAISMGPKYYKAIQEDIARHFVESVSEVIGRKVTSKEVNEATKTGWIYEKEPKNE